MKLNLRYLLLGLGSLGLFLLAIAQVSYAQSFQAGTSVSVGQPVDSSLYTAGQSVNIASEVNGDVICAGQTVIINAPVHGDVLCAGQTVIISAPIDGSVRVIAQNVTLDGAVGRNVSIVAQEATINQAIAGDTSFVGSDLVINKPIGRDLALAANTATINSTIGRNVSGRVTQLVFNSLAHVSGTVHYTSEQAATVTSGAFVPYLYKTTPAHKQTSQWFMSFSIGSAVFFIITALCTGLVLVLIAPKIFRQVSEQTKTHFWWALLTGFIASIVAPAIALMLTITVIGWPLALLFISIWVLLSLLSLPATAYYTGRLIVPRPTNAITLMLIGALIIAVLLTIPVINVVVLLISFWLGLGSLLLALRQKVQKPDYSLR